MPPPSLIVIGASRCGPTSLHRYLDRYPQIAMARDTRNDTRRFREFADWSV